MKKLKLVPKEKVRLVGFSKAKTKIVQPEIPYILFLIERMEGRKIMWPEVIRPMTKEEFSHGRTVIDEGHPRGAGHGQYDPQTYEVAVNKNMNPFDIAANIFHENLHHARPDFEEVIVRDTTGDAMLYLYGEYNLGKPYAEGRLKANPRRRRNANGIVIVKGRYVGSLADYLSKYAKDFTKEDLIRIKNGWDDYVFGEGWRQYYDFNDREYVQVFKEILYIDPDRVGFHVFNEYGDENWRWYRTATKKEKMEWAKDQWKRKGRNPIMIKVDANYGISTGDGHHRLRAAKLLRKQVPVVIESSTRSTYDEAKKIVEDNIPPRFRGNPKRRRNSESINMSSYEVLSMHPPHGVTDKNKLHRIYKSMFKGWKGRPLISLGNQLLTGAHRYAALMQLDDGIEFDVPVIDIEPYLTATEIEAILEAIDQDDVSIILHNSRIPRSIIAIYVQDLDQRRNPKKTSLEEFVRTLKQKYPISDISIYVRPSQPWHPIKSVHLSNIRISPSDRGKGIGSKVLTEIINFATSTNLPITLIPLPEDKDNVEKLRSWYRDHGFEDWYRTGAYGEEDEQRENTKYMIKNLDQRRNPKKTRDRKGQQLPCRR